MKEQNNPRIITLRCVVTCLVLAALSGCGKRSEETPAKSLEQGWSFFQLRDFTLATEKFQSAQRTTTQSDPLHVEAIYGEGSCWNLRREGRDPARAREKFKQVQQIAPHSPFAPWAALDTVRTYHLFTGDHVVDEKQLIAQYAEVVAKYPGTPAAVEAFLYESDLQFLSDDTPVKLRETERTLLKFVENHSGNPYLTQVYGSLGRIYQQLKEPEKQLKMALLSLNAAEADPTNPKFNFSGNYWSIAQLAQFQLGDFVTARNFYKRFIQEFPYDQRVFTAQRMLQQMDRIDREGLPK